jgi:hypothetical protein
MVDDPSAWFRSLPRTHIALVLNAGLNLGLLLALPFRRAINGIIVSVYRGWCERQHERRQILRELYAKMDTVKGTVARHIHRGAWSGMRFGRRTVP